MKSQELNENYLKFQYHDNFGKNIQFDLFNNAFFLIKKPLSPKNIEILKSTIKKKLVTQQINEIFVINLEKIKFKKKKKRIKPESLKQLKITFFIKNYEDLFQDNLYFELVSRLKFQDLTILHQKSLFDEIVPDDYNIIQYRGNKSSIINFLKPYFRENNTILDLMAGSNSVGFHLKASNQVICNDIQYYSFVLGEAFIKNNKYFALKPIPKKYILPNENFRLFQNEFADIYFTENQCIEIDNLRATLEKIKVFDKILYFCYLACLLKTLDWVARTAGHFDGALDRWTKKARIRENKSIIKEFNHIVLDFKNYRSKYNNKCYNLPARELLEKVPKVDIIYIDPPYNFRQYSRYYHLLETCAKYDKNIRIDSKGLYPINEFKSEFCYKEKVEKAFREILKLAVKKAKKKIIISYSNIGLLEHKKLLNNCREFDPQVKLYEKIIKYTRQKTSKPGRTEKELLYILNIKKNDWTQDFLPDGRKTLIITSCSKKKEKSNQKIESQKRYIGQIFNHTKNFANKNNYDLLIISAKHGLLHPEDKIYNYNRRLLNKKESLKLKPKVVPKLKKILKQENYKRIILIMGKLYRNIIEDLYDNRFVILESKNGIFDYLSKLKTLNEYN